MTNYNRDTVHLALTVPVVLMSKECAAVWTSATIARRWSSSWAEYLMCLESNLVHELAVG